MSPLDKQAETINKHPGNWPLVRPPVKVTVNQARELRLEPATAWRILPDLSATLADMGCLLCLTS